MWRRVLIPLAAVTYLPSTGLAGLLPWFDPASNTWNATHIVLTEDAKVVESWKGNLKPGDPLPDGAIRYARSLVPPPSPFDQIAGREPPKVSGKRTVLFLMHVPENDKPGAKMIWTDPYFRDPKYFVPEVCVGWVEDGKLYHAYQPINPGGYRLGEFGKVEALKKEVEKVLSLRNKFDRARAEKDLRTRAALLDEIRPSVGSGAGTLVGYIAAHDIAVEFGRCGDAAVPALTRWAKNGIAGDWDLAVHTIAGLGDAGLAAMLELIDAELGRWKPLATRPKPDGDPEFSLMAHQLHRVLLYTHRMKLTDEKQKALRNHPGIRELNVLLTETPGLKPAGSDAEQAHKILNDILAGKGADR
jgi:hypothetical protein